MAMQDENKHRPRRLRAGSGAAKMLLSWERRHMAINDQNKHMPRRFRNHGRQRPEKKDISTDKLFLTKWDRWLQKEVLLAEQTRRKRLRQRRNRRQPDNWMH